MKGNFLKIRNNVQFSLVGQDMSQIHDDFVAPFATARYGRTGTNGLMVSIAATHAGIITRNNGFYLPDKMRTGAKTFTDDYDKPVLLHHADHQDPIGRVIKAAYIDTSFGVQDKYNGKVVKNSDGKEIGVITDKLLHDFVNNKMPFGQQIDVVRTLFRDSLLDDKSYSGLGYVQIVANIADQEAIQKLLDGRYITGSVGATTNRAICSVCKQDWTEDGVCEHKPGALYDSAKCFIIAGDLLYDEYSFVNVPADRHSKVLELHYNGITDNIETANEFQNRLYEVQLSFPQYNPADKENFVMADNANKDTDDISIADSATDAEKVTDEKNADATAIELADTTDSSTEDNATRDVEGNSLVEDDIVSEEETAEDFVSRILDSETLSVEDEERSYELLWAEAEAAIADGELKMDVEIFADAKLSTAQRKKLAKSTFCGPNKSFPVPDCAHVTAARRLIGRAKVGDATKSKILACVSRKAKAMGCGSSSDSVTAASGTTKTNDSLIVTRAMRNILSTLEEDVYSGADPATLDEDTTKVFCEILKRLAGLVGKDQFIAFATEENLSVDPQCEQALLDEVEKQEELIGELRDQLVALRKEYNALFQDQDLMHDNLIEEKAKSRKIKEDYLVLLKTLHDVKVDKSELTALTDEAVDLEVARLVDEVDMNKIADKLGDGMSRTPNGNISDPNDVKDNSENKQVKISDEAMEKIEFNYNKILLQRGPQAAQLYIQNTKRSLAGETP